MKSIYTLVEDIYKLMDTREIGPDVNLDEEIEHFGEAMKDLMRKEFTPRDRDWETP